MKYTQLRDLTVSRIGLGCMGMSHLFTGKDQPDEVHIATLHRALELGVTFFDTAEIYGPFKNEVLVGKAFKGRRDEVVIATKFGMMTGEGEERKLGFDSTPANIRYAVEQSLKRLDMDYIDLYYQHRVDKNVPIEDVIGTLKELIDEGKIGHIGLSEAGQANIRRANAVHPITALQSEYSLWTRDGEDGTLNLLAELGIGFVPYSPLSRGMLSGKITTLDKFNEDDWRLTNPRFQPDAFEKNKQILGEVTSIAAEVGCTPAQLALAWLLAKGIDWAPIPGTVRINHLEEDIASVDVELTVEQVARLDKVTQPIGGHHTDAQMKMMDREI
jgi:aryl-alcohol dehydrogenase-like predicted oxidoreductase